MSDPAPFPDRLIALILAKTPVIQITTPDPRYTRTLLTAIAYSLDRELYYWDSISGLSRIHAGFHSRDIPAASFLRLYQKFNTRRNQPFDINHITELRKETNKYPEITAPSETLPSGIGNEHDILTWYKEPRLHPFLLAAEDLQYTDNHNLSTNTWLLSSLRTLAQTPRSDRTLLLIQTAQQLPEPLSRDIPETRCPYPDTCERKTIYQNILEEFSIPPPKTIPPELIDATRGLTTSETRRAYAVAIIKRGQLTARHIPDILSEKTHLINKGTTLTATPATATLRHLGGMDLLKIWLTHKQHTFTPEAKEFGITPPKGILLLGPPGTGKTLLAKTIAALWNWPLVNLDIGSIYGKWLGETEENMRNAIGRIDSLAPCILWIDEIEKAFAGTTNSNPGHETTTRIFGTLLT